MLKQHCDKETKNGKTQLLSKFMGMHPCFWTIQPLII